MILQKYVNIKINSRNFDYYKHIIKNIKNNNIYKISINQLFIGSHTKVLVSCDICNSEFMKPYRQYRKSYDNYNMYCCSPKCAQIKNKKTNLVKYGVENVFESDTIKDRIVCKNLIKYGVSYPSQSKEIRYKIIESLKNNYGVINPMHSEFIKQKLYKTNMDKYGASNYSSSEIAKEFRIKNKKQIPDNERSDFEKYKIRVRYLTNKVKHLLYKNWNGLDYYDNQFIKYNNIKYKFYERDYPTIDHKISIYYGFLNSIEPEVIAEMNNLCITKRSINSKKNRGITY